MIKERLVLRYARALAIYAHQEGVLDKIKQDYVKLKELLWDSKETRAYFLFPGIDKQEKKELLLKIKDCLKLEESFFRFMTLILEEERFNIFQDLYYKFLDIYQDYNKRIYVRVTSAFSLTNTEEQRIYDTLKAIFKKDLVIDKELDKNLLAGIDIFLLSEGLKINLSLRSRLDKLKEEVLRCR